MSKYFDLVPWEHYLCTDDAEQIEWVRLELFLFTEVMETENQLCLFLLNFTIPINLGLEALKSFVYCIIKNSVEP